MTEEVLLTWEDKDVEASFFRGSRNTFPVEEFTSWVRDLAVEIAGHDVINHTGMDWEGWGIAPAGFDAATLYLHSLLQPAIAKQVRAEFNELLEHQAGLISQLYVTTRMLLRIEHGDYPDLAVPLHRNAERVLQRLSSRR